MVVIDGQEVHHVVPAHVVVHRREQEVQQIGHAAAETDAVQSLESEQGNYVYPDYALVLTDLYCKRIP